MNVFELIRRNHDAAATARWFFRDFITRYKYELILITILGAAATTIQAGVLIVLNHLVSDGISTKLSKWINFSNSPIALAATLVVLLGLSGLFTYLCGKRTLALWPRYQSQALNSLFAALQDAVARNVVDAAAVNESGLIKALQDTQRLGAFSRLVTKTILPTLRLLTFSIYAAITNPITTLIAFAIVAPISGAILLYCSKKAAECDRNAESTARDYSKQLKERLNSYFDATIDPKSHRTDLDSNTTILQRTIHLVNRLVWVERTRFATTLITISMIGGLIVFSEIISETNWTNFLIYILSLLFAFFQLSSISSSISSFGYFYPTVSRHRRMLLALQSPTKKEYHAILRPSPIAAGNPQEEVELFE